MTTRRRLAVAGAMWALGGCAGGSGPRRLPMDLIRDDGACPQTLAPTLLVLLPGAFMQPAELVREGFIAAVRQRRLAVDLLLPDAHIGYVQDGSMPSRLRDEIIEPALAQGRRQIWLAGISMGGYVALNYALKHPAQIAGVLAIAPYLGRRPLLQDIARAGGPAAWRRSAQPRDAADIDHQAWMWLSDPQRRGPPIWLSYGTEDRLAEGHRLLAGVLPDGHVNPIAGGHDWPPWRSLWAQWLDRGLLPRSPDGCA